MKWKVLKTKKPIIKIKSQKKWGMSFSCYSIRIPFSLEGKNEQFHLLLQLKYKKGILKLKTLKPIAILVGKDFFVSERIGIVRDIEEISAVVIEKEKIRLMLQGII